MTLINHHEIIVRKIIKQTERTRSLLSAIKKTAIVLDAVAITQFPHHLHIKCHSLFNALGFQIPSFLFKETFMFYQFIFNITDDHFQAVLRSDVKISRKNSGMGQVFQMFSGFRIDHFNTFNLVPKKCNPVAIVNIRQVNLDTVAPNAELTTRHHEFGTAIKTFDQTV